MFKKTLIAGAVLAASTGLAFANGGTYAPPVQHHTGAFYVGVGASRDFTHYDTTQTHEYYYDAQFDNIEIPGAPPMQAFGETHTNSHRTTRHDFGDNGWNGDVFAGYGMTFQNHYYLGAELFGSISNNKAKYSSVGDSSMCSSVDMFDSQQIPIASFDLNVDVSYTEHKEFKLKHSYGISIMPGIKLSESTMLYGRVGWIRSRFDLRVTGQAVVDVSGYSSGSQPPTVTPLELLPSLGSQHASLVGNTKKTEDGIQLGVGVETMFHKNLSLRAEYDWSRYNNINVSMKQVVSTPIYTTMQVAEPLGNLTVTHNVTVKDPTVDQFKLALVYHFVS